MTMQDLLYKFNVRADMLILISRFDIVIISVITFKIISIFVVNHLLSLKYLFIPEMDYQSTKSIKEEREEKEEK
jgi:hypothetical protein